LDLQNLADEVGRQTTVESSASLLIQRIADAVRSDQTQIARLIADLQASQAALAAAIEANTHPVKSAVMIEGASATS